MTKRSFTNRIRAASIGQSVIPLSLLALVAAIGGLVYHTRTLEASHLATAENALRDYAALAAWQYNQQAETYLENTAHITLHNVHQAMRVSDRPLPAPDTIVTFGDTESCGIGRAARFSFRVDLATRTGTFAGAAPDPAVRAAIVRRFVELAATAPRGRHTSRMFIDTVGGAARVIAYGVALGVDSMPRALYGVEADLSSIVPELTEIPTAGRALLPTSLLRGKRADSVLMVQVRRPDGVPLTTVGSTSSEHLAAEATMSANAGALLTRVVVRPEAASMLLIGGVPGSRLNTMLFLLAGSVLLAAIALIQLRRGRELTRLRTRFIANVSHELRTPLAQISMFSETLLLGRARSADESQQFLSVIFREARRLSHLVESVLRFSRTEALPGTRKLQLRERDVALEVRDAVRGFTPLAAASGAELRLDITEHAVARVEPDSLRQIVLNLLDNAVKFGPEQQEIAVRVERAGDQVVVSVTDEGPGIPVAERRRVFEPFTQGSSSQSRKTTGAGIGLSVVADLVAVHGGRVWIDDAPSGRGARVAFAIPAVSATTSASQQRYAPADLDQREESLATR